MATFADNEPGNFRAEKFSISDTQKIGTYNLYTKLI